MASDEKHSGPKDAAVPTAVVNEEKEAKEGYVLDAADYDANNLKLTDDGKTVLIPQPTDDPDDPLNWPRSKKLAIVLVMSTIAFLPEFGSATGIPAIVPQSMYVAASLLRTLSDNLGAANGISHRIPSS